jgi:hypothetical protein
MREQLYSLIKIGEYLFLRIFCRADEAANAGLGVRRR